MVMMGSLNHLLVPTCGWLLAATATATDGPSIMELINTNNVRRLHLNNTKPTPAESHYHLTKPDFVDYKQEEIADINSNSVGKQPKKLRQNLPDFSTVLSDLMRPDPTSLLVAKKELIRKDWCKSEPIIQRIREEGCVPKNVVNRFCYGQCNSFYIPKNLAARRGKRKKGEEREDAPAFRSCGVCKPKKTSWMQITIQCPGLVPAVRKRKVLKIRECQCMAENFPL